MKATIVTPSQATITIEGTPEEVGVVLRATVGASSLTGVVRLATSGQGDATRGGRDIANGGRARRKPPRQLCPAPGCKNPAAPVFGMVCAKHKDVPKAKIKEYREARRRSKARLT
jgi:hypothetical protein